MAGSNYEVNIKLNLKSVNKQLNNLEKRISRINKLAQGGRASRTVNKNEQEKLKSATKRFQIETRNTREQKKQTSEKRKQFKIDQDNLKLINQKSTGGGRSTGGGVVGGGNKGKGGGILSSALISGSFPLLFGQGLPGAVAGGLGGGIGAKFGGQMGGFAGGLVATALLQTFNNIKDGINQFGAELNDPTKNLDALITRIKVFDSSIETSVNTLKNAGLEQVAGELASLTMEQRFGTAGTDALKSFNDELSKFGKRTKDLTTRLAILVSGPLTLFFKLLNTGSKDVDKANKKLTTSELTEKQQNKLEADLAKEKELRLKVESLQKRNNALDEEMAILQERSAANLPFTKGRGDKLSKEEKSRLFDLEADRFDRAEELSNAKELLKKAKDSVTVNERILEIRKLEEEALASTGKLLNGQIKLEQLKAELTRGNVTEKDVAIEQKLLDIAKAEQKILVAEANLRSLINNKAKEGEVEIARERLKNLTKELNLVTLIANERINAADPAISRMDELNRKMRDLNDTTLQSVNLSKAMGESFEESFKGIVKGTMTVQDAFRNMLNRIADFFLDTAAQLAANQLQKGILGLFSNLFNFSTTPLNDIQSDVRFAANGGPAGMRKPFIVGERGPELFVPNQSGNIIPNHDLAGIGGGSTNIVVNVDASGSSVEGDEQGGRELGRVISAAVQSELIQQKRPGGLLA